MNIQKEIQTFKSNVKKFSYRDVLIEHDTNNPNRPIKYFHLSDFAKYADELGYPYLLWRRTIYQKENGNWMRTPWGEFNIH